MTYDCSCDYEPADFYFDSKPRARKQYKCYDCSGAILPGERYERVFASWEGHTDTFRTCERCYDIRMWIKNNVPCFCYMHGGLTETAEEAIEEARYRAKDEVKGLKFGYLRRVVLRDKLNKERRQAAGMKY